MAARAVNMRIVVEASDRDECSTPQDWAKGKTRSRGQG